ncbi:hypothetical protein [Myroides guanonis]|uniref:Uncharacterized protein n=1 Tax=Myroides guanonis TaxID=1150112 RepID=A0A1I3V3A4_9FLAO|nr:hypothetical protein [Myroides guanonis]SFJ88836.1 hypothetical protein SAMN04487893_1226 [Myroides guanonis]
MSILVDKYRKTTVVCLAVILQFIGLMFFDMYVLPKTNIEDTITHYQNIKTGKNDTNYLGSQFYTEKGKTFSLEKNNFELNEVVLEETLLFKSITAVRNEKKDYTNILISDLSGITLVLTIGLVLSSGFGILVLERQQNVSENKFLNIVSLNSLLFLVTLYMYFIQS